LLRRFRGPLEHGPGVPEEIVRACGSPPWQALGMALRRLCGPMDCWCGRPEVCGPLEIMLPCAGLRVGSLGEI
jgi:hypothetical protein